MALFLTAGILCWNNNPLPSVILVPLISLLSAFLILYGNVGLLENKILGGIGERSYSIFIWHQTFLAFYRYYFINHFGLIFLVFYWILVILFAQLTYMLIEKRITKFGKKAGVVFALLFIFTSATAVMIYLHAGVVRDVPELGISVQNAHRGMHSEYCDRIYAYDKDYENDGRIKVFVIGYSYARDFANVLLESEYGDSVDLSYALTYSPDYNNRIAMADLIFIYGERESYPDALFDLGSGERWGIGPKNFGESNGIFYRQRFSDHYFDQAVFLDDQIIEQNAKESKFWGDHYIDMIAALQHDDGSVPVFTDDHMFISQDCRHLTKAGARYYARLIDWKDIFDIND